MSDLATLTIRVDASGAIRVVDQFGTKVEEAAQQADRLGAAAKRAGVIIGGSLAAGLALATKETIDGQREQAQLAAALRSTAGASGQTIDSLNEQAAALRQLTAATGGEIAEAQALLLTFTKIGGDVFPRATAAVLDMATALGTDARSAAMQLGKALNDPILGVTALGRAGVQFSESQKATIKAMVETNRIAEAQGVILRELETQVGGSAAAYRNTLGGALDALRESFAELFDLGSGPGMQRLIDNLNIAADAMGMFGTQSALAFARSDRALAQSNLRIGGFLLGATGGRLGGGIAATAAGRFGQADNDVQALERLLAEQQQGVLDGIIGRARAGAGGRLGGGTDSGSAAVAAAAVTTTKLVEGLKAAQLAASEFAKTIDDNLRAKTLTNLKASLDAVKEAEAQRQEKSVRFWKAQLEATKNEEEAVTALTESSRVFAEQTQMALARFGSNLLRDGLGSLDRFWDEFVQLGRDAIGNVFAKSVMDRLGAGLGDKLAGALSGIGGAGLGIVGAVGVGLAAGFERVFGESKWERIAEENRRAARAMAEAAEGLRASMFVSRERWMDDFLNYANNESPMQRELRSLGLRRNELARSAFDIATQAGGSLSNQTLALLNRGQFGGNVAELVRRDANQINQTELGRQALLDFADALEMLNRALTDNIGAASDAARAQQELTLAQFRDQLGVSAMDNLSPVARLAEAQRQYDAILALAQGGDASAVDSLPETARTLLEAARETFASGVRYQNLFAAVRDDVDTLLAAVRGRRPTAGFDEAVPYEGSIDFAMAEATGTAVAEALDWTPVTQALAEQTDRALAVHTAHLAVTQAGFLETVKAIGYFRSDAVTLLAAIEFAIRSSGQDLRPPAGGESLAAPSVGFDY